jgi:hypothetical protein
MTFDRDAWRKQWRENNPDKMREQLDRDNAKRKSKRKEETPEEREARLAKSREKHKRWRDANPERLKVYRNKGRSKNYNTIRKSQRDYALRTTYGITLAQYNEMLTAQGNCCAICSADKASTRHTDHSWRVDHCHTTGKVRALLCHNCNIAMGLLKESTTTLQSMIAYLNHHTITHGGNDNEDPDSSTDRHPKAQLD